MFPINNNYNIMSSQTASSQTAGRGFARYNNIAFAGGENTLPPEDAVCKDIILKKTPLLENNENFMDEVEFNYINPSNFDIFINNHKFRKKFAGRLWIKLSPLNILEEKAKGVFADHEKINVAVNLKEGSPEYIYLLKLKEIFTILHENSAACEGAACEGWDLNKLNPEQKNIILKEANDFNISYFHYKNYVDLNRFHDFYNISMSPQGVKFYDLLQDSEKFSPVYKKLAEYGFNIEELNENDAPTAKLLTEVFNYYFTTACNSIDIPKLSYEAQARLFELHAEIYSKETTYSADKRFPSMNIISDFLASYKESLVEMSFEWLKGNDPTGNVVSNYFTGAACEGIDERFQTREDTQYMLMGLQALGDALGQDYILSQETENGFILPFMQKGSIGEFMLFNKSSLNKVGCSHTGINTNDFIPVLNRRTGKKHFIKKQDLIAKGKEVESLMHKVLSLPNTVVEETDVLLMSIFNSAIPTKAFFMADEKCREKHGTGVITGAIRAIAFTGLGGKGLPRAGKPEITDETQFKLDLFKIAEHRLTEDKAELNEHTHYLMITHRLYLDTSFIEGEPTLENIHRSLACAKEVPFLYKGRDNKLEFIKISTDKADRRITRELAFSILDLGQNKGSLSAHADALISRVRDAGSVEIIASDSIAGAVDGVFVKARMVHLHCMLNLLLAPMFFANLTTPEARRALITEFTATMEKGSEYDIACYVGFNLRMFHGAPKDMALLAQRGFKGAKKLTLEVKKNAFVVKIDGKPCADPELIDVFLRAIAENKLTLSSVEVQELNAKLVLAEFAKTSGLKPRADKPHETKPKPAEKRKDNNQTPKPQPESARTQTTILAVTPNGRTVPVIVNPNAPEKPRAEKPRAEKPTVMQAEGKPKEETETKPAQESITQQPKPWDELIAEKKALDALKQGKNFNQKLKILSTELSKIYNSKIKPGFEVKEKSKQTAWELKLLQDCYKYMRDEVIKAELSSEIKAVDDLILGIISGDTKASLIERLLILPEEARKELAAKGVLIIIDEKAKDAAIYRNDLNLIIIKKDKNISDGIDKFFVHILERTPKAETQQTPQKPADLKTKETELIPAEKKAELRTLADNPNVSSECKLDLIYQELQKIYNEKIEPIIIKVYKRSANLEFVSNLMQLATDELIIKYSKETFEKMPKKQREQLIVERTLKMKTLVATREESQTIQVMLRQLQDFYLDLTRNLTQEDLNAREIAIDKIISGMVPKAQRKLLSETLSNLHPTIVDKLENAGVLIILAEPKKLGDFQGVYMKIMNSLFIQPKSQIVTDINFQITIYHELFHAIRVHKDKFKRAEATYKKITDILKKRINGETPRSEHFKKTLNNAIANVKFSYGNTDLAKEVNYEEDVYEEVIASLFGIYNTKARSNLEKYDNDIYLLLKELDENLAIPENQPPLPPDAASSGREKNAPVQNAPAQRQKPNAHEKLMIELDNSKTNDEIFKVVQNACEFKEYKTAAQICCTTATGLLNAIETNNLERGGDKWFANMLAVHSFLNKLIRIINDFPDEQTLVDCKKLYKRSFEECSYNSNNYLSFEAQGKIIVIRTSIEELKADLDAATNIVAFKELESYRAKEPSAEILVEYFNKCNECAANKLPRLFTEYSASVKKLQEYYKDILRKAEKLNYPPKLLKIASDSFAALLSDERLSSMTAYIGLALTIEKQYNSYKPNKPANEFEFANDSSLTRFFRSAEKQNLLPKDKLFNLFAFCALFEDYCAQRIKNGQTKRLMKQLVKELTYPSSDFEKAEDIKQQDARLQDASKPGDIDPPAQGKKSPFKKFTSGFKAGIEAARRLFPSQAVTPEGLRTPVRIADQTKLAQKPTLLQSTGEPSSGYDLGGEPENNPNAGFLRTKPINEKDISDNRDSIDTNPEKDIVEKFFGDKKHDTLSSGEELNERFTKANSENNLNRMINIALKAYQKERYADAATFFYIVGSRIISDPNMTPDKIILSSGFESHTAWYLETIMENLGEIHGLFPDNKDFALYFKTLYQAKKEWEAKIPLSGKNKNNYKQILARIKEQGYPKILHETAKETFGYLLDYNIHLQKFHGSQLQAYYDLLEVAKKTYEEHRFSVSQDYEYFKENYQESRLEDNPHNIIFNLFYAYMKDDLSSDHEFIKVCIKDLITELIKPDDNPRGVDIPADAYQKPTRKELEIQANEDEEFELLAAKLAEGRERISGAEILDSERLMKKFGEALEKRSIIHMTIIADEAYTRKLYDTAAGFYFFIGSEIIGDYKSDTIIYFPGAKPMSTGELFVKIKKRLKGLCEKFPANEEIKEWYNKLKDMEDNNGEPAKKLPPDPPPSKPPAAKPPAGKPQSGEPQAEKPRADKPGRDERKAFYTPEDPEDNEPFDPISGYDPARRYNSGERNGFAKKRAEQQRDVHFVKLEIGNIENRITAFKARMDGGDISFEHLLFDISECIDLFGTISQEIKTQNLDGKIKIELLRHKEELLTIYFPNIMARINALDELERAKALDKIKDIIPARFRNTSKREVNIAVGRVIEKVNEEIKREHDFAVIQMTRLKENGAASLRTTQPQAKLSVLNGALALCSEIYYRIFKKYKFSAEDALFINGENKLTLKENMYPENKAEIKKLLDEYNLAAEKVKDAAQTYQKEYLLNTQGFHNSLSTEAREINEMIFGNVFSYDRLAIIEILKEKIPMNALKALKAEGWIIIAADRDALTLEKLTLTSRDENICRKDIKVIGIAASAEHLMEDRLLHEFSCVVLSLESLVKLTAEELVALKELSQSNNLLYENYKSFVQGAEASLPYEMRRKIPSREEFFKEFFAVNFAAYLQLRGKINLKNELCNNLFFKKMSRETKEQLIDELIALFDTIYDKLSGARPR